MKTLTILLLVLATAACISAEPKFLDWQFQQEVITKAFPSIIEKIQSLTLIPVRTSFKIKNFFGFNPSKVENSTDLYGWPFSLTFEDEDRIDYKTEVSLIFNVTNNSSNVKEVRLHSWNTTLSSNKNLPLFVEFETPYNAKWYAMKNITKEIYDFASIPSTLAKLAPKQARPVQNLACFYENIKVSPVGFEYLKIGYIRSYDSTKKESVIVGLYYAGSVDTQVTADYKGEQHTYNLSLTSFNIHQANSIQISHADLIPLNDTKTCRVLQDAGFEQAVKVLQEQRRLPPSNYTMKQAKCEVIPSSERASRGSPREYNINVVFASPENALYHVGFRAEVGGVMGYFKPLNFIDNFKKLSHSK